MSLLQKEPTRVSGGPKQVVVIEPRREGLVHSLREAWAYRGLLGYFARRFLQKRYMRTWLGWLWLPLRPLTTVLSRALVFGGVIGIATGSVPYVLFFLIGQAAWTLFYEATYWSTRSLELNRATLRRVHVPRLIPLLASIVPSIVDCLIYLGMAAVMVVWYTLGDGEFPLVLTWRTPYALIGASLLCALGVGLGLLTSVFAMRARDIRFMLGYFLSFWYFFTPVIYPFEAFPAKYRTLASLNPATGPVELVKVGLFGTGHLTITAIVITMVTIGILWIVGLMFFLSREAAAASGA